MIAIVEASALNKSLKKIQKYIPRYGLVECAGRIALVAAGNRLELHALNPGESMHAIARIDATVTEEGAWTAELKPLLAVKSARRGDDITLTGRYENLKVAANGPTFCVPATQGRFGGTELLTPDMAQEIELTEQDCAAFQHILPALSQDITRPDFMGAHMNNGYVTATDGHRLHYGKVSGEVAGIIPGAIVRAIADNGPGRLSLLRKPNVEAYYRYTTTDGCFGLTAREIAGTWPDFSAIIRATHGLRDYHTMQIDAAELRARVTPAIKGYAIAAAHIMQHMLGIELRIGLFSRSGNKLLNEVSLILAADGEIPETPIVLNAQFMLDAVARMDGPIEVAWLDADCPVFLGPDAPTYSTINAIVMPMDPEG